MIQRKAAKGGLLDGVSGVRGLPSASGFGKKRTTGGGGKRGNETLSPLESDTRRVSIDLDGLRGYIAGGASGLTPGLGDMEIS